MYRGWVVGGYRGGVLLGYGRYVGSGCVELVWCGNIGVWVVVPCGVVYSAVGWCIVACVIWLSSGMVVFGCGGRVLGWYRGVGWSYGVGGAFGYAEVYMLVLRSIGVMCGH